jgi:hypothetical protein
MTLLYWLDVLFLVALAAVLAWLLFLSRLADRHD